MELHGKNVLITGASRRIGRQIALTLAECGATILIHYNHSRSEAQSLKREIEIAGGAAILFRANFSSRNGSISLIRKFLKEVYRSVRHVDVLVNNAAIFYPTPLGKISEKTWDEFLTVNLKIPFFLAQEIGMRMKKQKSGKIINLVDWTGLKPPVDYLPYAISKAGLIATTTGLARALAPYVQVVSIAPGPILPSKGMSAGKQKLIVKKSLLKRFGSPADIAHAVRFVVEDTDFITGAFIPVDGGSLIA